VQLTTPDSEVEQLDLKLMDAAEAGLRRHWIRTHKGARTFLFGKDMIWTPIVGSEKASGDQYKWESLAAGTLLNDPAKTQKQIV
jgi:hypothetical protein